jgi:NCAIR mutase (PurE)-related protein
MQYRDNIKKLLVSVGRGETSAEDAYGALRDLPYQDIGFAKLDNHRSLRRGFPEVVYCKGKTDAQVEGIVKALYPRSETLLLTFATDRLYKKLKRGHSRLKFNETAGIIYKGAKKPATKKEVLVITGGTADLPVAEQARVTLEVMGNKATTLYDAGVAGLHRLLDHKDKIKKANVIIVAAGMEGALASVVSGLVSRPVIAVPTSVGYGASFEGLAPLLTMLNSCSPGIGVVNIDNGFGAGYLASLINK